MIELAERFGELKTTAVRSQGTANDRFCDALFPETVLNPDRESTLTEKKKRQEKKRTVEYWVGLGTRLRFMVQRFGYAKCLFGMCCLHFDICLSYLPY